MDESEKLELSKQKKLLDCANSLNGALTAFDRLEQCKIEILPMLNEFDLTHGDTYLELTQSFKCELSYLTFFSQSAAADLAAYRQLLYPNSTIYSVKQRKIIARDNLTSLVEQKSLPKFSDTVKKTESQVKQEPDKELTQIKVKISRIEWAIFVCFSLQILTLILIL